MGNLIALLAALSTCRAVADTASLQWSICDSSPAVVLQKLGLAGATQAKDSNITYYDTATGTYTTMGLSFRSKDGKKNLVSEVKVRFTGAQSGISPAASCDWQRYGNSEAYSCTEDGAAADGNAPWTQGQMDFVGTYDSVAWSSLTAFGPYGNPKWDVSVDGSKGVFDSVEAGSLHLMELEIEVDKSADDSTYAAVTTALQSAGVVLCDRQEGKTFRLLRALGILPPQ